MKLQALFFILGLVLACCHFGVADVNVTATSKPSIRGGLGNRPANVQVAKRLLWRNETPLDDDYAEPEHNGLRPEIINDALGYVVQVDGEDASSTASTTEAAAEEEVTEIVEEESDIASTIDEEFSEIVDEDDLDENISNSTETDSVEEDATEVGQNQELEIEAVLDGNGKQDCLWRVLTGTGCTSVIYGNIVQGVQHEYLVADGECHYNDFLGYYRAGCKRKIDMDGVDDASLPANKAKVILTDVFCKDSTCSKGCQKNAIIGANSVYTSNFCYLSAFREQGEDESSKKERKKDDEEFSFEFVGACLETENCNVIS